MNDGTGLATDAIGALRKLQQFHLRSAEELERAIFRIRTGSCAENQITDIEHKYQGSDRKSALRMYFKDRRGRRIPVEEVAKDFLRFKVDQGEPYGQEPPLKTMIHNLKKIVKAQSQQKREPKIVEFDPMSWELWAADTIDDPTKPKKWAYRKKRE
ncbi:MAG TPA: hypothetical protein VFO46_05845 [Candidatus Sulfotelmatobacter sp.]|nr:hypothetical protein [Candidatus Sulfotelmatobacter sp.]